MLATMEGVKCTFCAGLGHISSECSSKKNVDMAVRRAPSLRILWGTLKGNSKSTGKRTSAQVGGAERMKIEIDATKRFKAGPKGAGAKMDLE